MAPDKLLWSWRWRCVLLPPHAKSQQFPFKWTERGSFTITYCINDHVETFSGFLLGEIDAVTTSWQLLTELSLMNKMVLVTCKKMHHSCRWQMFFTTKIQDSSLCAVWKTWWSINKVDCASYIHPHIYNKTVTFKNSRNMKMSTIFHWLSNTSGRRACSESAPYHKLSINFVNIPVGTIICCYRPSVHSLQWSSFLHCSETWRSLNKCHHFVRPPRCSWVGPHLSIGSSELILVVNLAKLFSVFSRMHLKWF